MAKVFNYIILLTGLILLYEIAGIDTGAKSVLSMLGIQWSSTGTIYYSFSASSFFDALFSTTGILTAIAAGGAITIGLFKSSNPENYVILGFITSTLVLFISAFVNIIGKAAESGNWISWVVVLIMAPLAVGYIISLVDYFRGND